MVIALARQMAFMARLSAGKAVNPRLRQGGAQAAVWQVDDVDPAQRVEMGTNDVGQAGLEGRRWPGIEIGADGLTGQLVERRRDQHANAVYDVLHRWRGLVHDRLRALKLHPARTRLARLQRRLIHVRRHESGRERIDADVRGRELGCQALGQAHDCGLRASVCAEVREWTECPATREVDDARLFTFHQQRQHALGNEIGSFQVDFDRAPPATAVSDGDGPDLAKSARAVDQHVHRVGLGRKRGDKISHLPVVRDVADKSLNPRKILGNACQTIGTPGADEDTMAFARERLRQPRANAGAAAGYYDPKGSPTINGFALYCRTALEFGNSYFVDALAYRRPRHGVQTR